MASIGEVVDQNISRYELRRRKKYVEYLKHQNDKRENILSYDEWKREYSKANGVNNNPHLYSLPSIKKNSSESEPELPRYPD